MSDRRATIGVASAPVSRVAVTSQATVGGVRELGRWFRQQPECRFAAAASGTVSLIAHVVLPDTAGLVDFVDERLAERGVQCVDILRMGTVLKRNAP